MLVLLKWNKESREKFVEMTGKCETITVCKNPLLYGKEKTLCYEMMIGSEPVYVTPKFFNKLIELGILVDETPVTEVGES